MNPNARTTIDSIAPGSVTYSPEELRKSRVWCRNIARKTAKNFYYSFMALSGEKFHGMCALYAFMRVTDDLGDDLTVPLANRDANLRHWSQQLQNLTSRHLEDHPVWPALHETRQKFAIPVEHLAAVIDGVRLDLLPVAMQSFSELERYCYHVAGAVGFCCLRIWGTDSPAADKLALDCGLAFQLTNILRDLREDAGLGRLYLPQEDLDQFGYSRQDLEAGRQNAAFRQLMQFEIERARTYYRSAEQLEHHLTPDARPVIRTMLRIYREILETIAARNYDVFSSRVRLSGWRKSRIVMSELLRSYCRH